MGLPLFVCFPSQYCSCPLRLGNNIKCADSFSTSHRNFTFGADLARLLSLAATAHDIGGIASTLGLRLSRSTIVPLASRGLPVVAIFRSRYFSVARCKSDVLDALVFGFSERKTNCRLVLFLIPPPIVRKSRFWRPFFTKIF